MFLTGKLKRLAANRAGTLIGVDDLGSTEKPLPFAGLSPAHACRRYEQSRLVEILQRNQAQMPIFVTQSNLFARRSQGRTLNSQARGQLSFDLQFRQLVKGYTSSRVDGEQRGS